MKTVLAGVDNSAAARRVIEAAAALAPLLDATLEAVHIVENHDGSAAEIARAFDVPLHTFRGDPVRSLTELCRRDDVVAVVVGARGRPNSVHPIGHVVLALANALEVPILVVPPEARAPIRVEDVLIAMKGTAASSWNLRRVITMADAARIHLVVLHVDDEESVPSFSDQVQYETEAFTREFLARNLPGAPDTRLELRIGVPAEEIVRLCESSHPDVVAIGWPTSHDPQRGHTARAVLERSRVPVLLVAVQ
jgi:nucleotide-binding universal stress UspA family protein